MFRAWQANPLSSWASQFTNRATDSLFHEFLPLACPTVHEKCSVQLWMFTCFFHKLLPVLRCSSHHKTKKELIHRIRYVVLAQPTASKQGSVITPNNFITEAFMTIKLSWIHKHVVQLISNSDLERLLKSHVVLAFVYNNAYGLLLLFVVLAPRQIFPSSMLEVCALLMGESWKAAAVADL